MFVKTYTIQIGVTTLDKGTISCTLNFNYYVLKQNTQKTINVKNVCSFSQWLFKFI
jgi:hypothetical protein